jgi:hypothetical protein
MWGCRREDPTTNIRKVHSGCGEQNRKGFDGRRKGEGIGRSKLKRMGMMGKWMEVGTHLGIRVKLTFGSPLYAC